MSYIKTTDITCDGPGDGTLTGFCGDALSYACVPTATEARKHAKKDGWFRRDGLDLCPECYERLYAN